MRYRLAIGIFVALTTSAAAQNLTSSGDLKPPTCPSNKFSEAAIVVGTSSTALTGGTIISGPAITNETWQFAYQAEVYSTGASTAGLSKGGATLASVAGSPIQLPASPTLYTFPEVMGSTPTMISTSSQTYFVSVCRR